MNGSGIRAPATRSEQISRLSSARCTASSARSRLLRPGVMSATVTYYAIVDALSSRQEPAGLLRRVEHKDGQRDEAFGYDLAWRHTFLLYSAERGNLDNQMHEIGGAEADRIAARIRQSSHAQQI